MSEFEPTEKAKHLFDWLAPELRAFYAKAGRRMTRNQLKLEIEIRWGKQIIQRVCIPNRMSRGECLVLAELAAVQ